MASMLVSLHEADSKSDISEWQRPHILGKSSGDRLYDGQGVANCFIRSIKAFYHRSRARGGTLGFLTTA